MIQRRLLIIYILTFSSILFTPASVLAVSEPTQDEVARAIRNATGDSYKDARISKIGGCWPIADGNTYNCPVSIQYMLANTLFTRNLNVYLKKDWFGWSLAR